MTKNAPGQKSNRLMTLGATAGLLPMLLAIPAFVGQHWAVGLAILLCGSAIIIGSQLARKKPISGLTIVSVILSVIIGIGYFAFDNTFLLKHFGVVINLLLLSQVVYGEIRGVSWTAQFSKRMYPPDRWTSPAFIKGNQFVSRLWGAIFVISILMSGLGTTPLTLYILPNVLLIAALIVGPALGRIYGRRFLV